MQTCRRGVSRAKSSCQRHPHNKSTLLLPPVVDPRPCAHQTRAAKQTMLRMDAAPSAAAPAHDKQLGAVEQANRSLGPYLLWDKALKLQAVWDRRAENQADLAAVVQLLAEHTQVPITVDSNTGGKGQQLTTLTIITKQDAGDEVAAALLQLTPATHISAAAIELSYLPQHKLSVSTPFGVIDVHLSLAGSRVCKITPDWEQCEQAAASASGKPAAAGSGSGIDCVEMEGNGAVVDAAGVAAAAVQALQAGLDSGEIELGTQYLF